MTISRAFVKFLEDKGCGIFGQNIFLYRVPNSLKTQTELYWVIPSGGMKVSTNKTGEAQNAAKRAKEKQKLQNIKTKIKNL